MNKLKLSTIFFLLCVTLFCPFAFAVEEDCLTSTFSSSNQYSIQQIQNNLQKEIDGYLSTEYDGVLDYSDANSWIPLYDFGDEQFAYLVPLIDENTSEEVGYIIVGSIETGYDSYLAQLDTEFLNTVRNELDSDLVDEAQIIYAPPFEYCLKSEHNSTQSYYSLSPHQAYKTDITEKVEQNFQELVQFYSFVSESNNDVSCINQSTEALTRTAILDYRLEKEAEGQFVPVPFNGSYSYGGDQAWYLSSAGNNAGCGPVAASNIMYYMADSDSKYEKLFPYNSLAYANFLDLMEEMFDRMNPLPAGEWIIGHFANDVWTYAFYNNYNSLNYITTICNNNLNACKTTIMNGLSGDHPVACLNANTTPLMIQEHYFDYHWVTITKYYQGAYDQRWIAVSSWGERFSFDFDMYYDAINAGAIKGGFVYFY